jgi:hypothetical protein
MTSKFHCIAWSSSIVVSLCDTSSPGIAVVVDFALRLQHEETKPLNEGFYEGLARQNIVAHLF